MRTLVKGVILAAAFFSACAVQAADYRYRYVLSDKVPYDWKTIETRYDDWVDKGSYYSCTNWSPSASSVGKGISFTQKATDCKQDQTRTGHPQQRDSRTNLVQDVPGAAFTEQRTIAATHSQDAAGILENWVTFAPTYTDWKDTNALYGCTAWSPDPSTIKQNNTFTQVSNSCNTDQSRQRQDREQETYTSDIRNSGAPVDETQTLTGQAASRLYTVSLTPWVNSGAIANCTNWSPATSTVTINQSFTQNATDCAQPQTRTRSEIYVDHRSGSTVPVKSVAESQSVTTTDTRTAVGTKETWVATTPSYGGWVNASAITGCTSWTPSPSNYTVRTQFTQTGSGCNVTQVRGRQNREMETTTNAVRNADFVLEYQTIGGQTSSRSYLMDFSGWVDSGGYYSCSAWTPDVSTVASGTAFTQTANCYINQTRGAAGYTDNGGWVADPAVPYRTEAQAIIRGVAQTATGTASACKYVAGNTQWGVGQAMDHVTMITYIMYNGVTTSYAGVGTSYGGYTRGALIQANLWQVCK
jgi:hypothetical protein